jgi:hypothetical protein
MHKLITLALAALSFAACTKQNGKMANEQMNKWSGCSRLVKK